jgi:hypothetical protein
MGWNTYIVNQTGRDVWCFWSTNPAITAGWDSTYGFQVPAGKSCSSNRGGLCLFGLGAMFEPYPPRSLLVRLAARWGCRVLPRRLFRRVVVASLAQP